MAEYQRTLLNLHHLTKRSRREGEDHMAFEAIIGRSKDFPGDRAKRRRRNRRMRVARNGEVVLWEADRNDDDN